MPPYILKELSKKEELDEIVEVILEAQYSPYVPSASLFFPVFGVSASDRQVTIEASKERLWKSHQANSASHWIFVEDLATNKIVAATQWELFLSNPFTSESLGIEAYWWPEGEARSFCSALLRQAYTPRFLWMKRPHTGLNLMVVHSKHRHSGLGSLLMNWGLAKAKEHNLEGFIESSELGRPLYEKFGYKVVMKVSFYNPDVNSSPLCRKLAHDIMPHPWYAMWRPISGEFQEGDPKAPWEIAS